MTVPIEKLHPTLRQQVLKTKLTSELNRVAGAIPIPIRVGDAIQFAGQVGMTGL